VRKEFSGKEKATGTSVAIGIIIGSVIGVLTDNVGLWIALGVAIGAGVGVIRAKNA
jgi:galactitol-specific phosphotransferase system IIC component